MQIKIDKCRSGIYQTCIYLENKKIHWLITYNRKKSKMESNWTYVVLYGMFYDNAFAEMIKREINENKNC